MKLGAARSLPLRPAVGHWFRAIRPRHWPAALATDHTPAVASRFNPASPQRPSFEVLYLAADHTVALFEVGALVGSALPGGIYLPNPRGAWTIVTVEVHLSRVADLTDPSNLALLQTSVQELTGDWQSYSLRPDPAPIRPPYWTNVPTQRLGRSLFKMRGLEGFLAYSAKNPLRTNLIVFPSKLRAGSLIRFEDPDTGAVAAVP
jgi:hypothetical protein